MANMLRVCMQSVGIRDEPSSTQSTNIPSTSRTRDFFGGERVAGGRNNGAAATERRAPS